METALRQALVTEMDKGGTAYVRNLAAAEQAVLRGQFNLAKVLRAAAHAQRVMAMNAARLLADQFGTETVLEAVLSDIQEASDQNPSPSTNLVFDRQYAQMMAVRAGLRDIIERAVASLAVNSDVLESDVAQFLRGCHGCGCILEGGTPDVCPICGALGVEFEGYGPFYSSTPEHLGQLTPEMLVGILSSVPDKVEAVVSEVDLAILQRKPSQNEWSAAEIVGHMLETDRLFAQRARALLAAQGRELPLPVAPWILHEGKGYESMPVARLMELMRAARRDSLSLILSLEQNDWALRGLNFGAKITMLDLCTWLANHDRGHLEQIKRLCKL